MALDVDLKRKPDRFAIALGALGGFALLAFPGALEALRGRSDGLAPHPGPQELRPEDDADYYGLVDPSGDPGARTGGVAGGLLDLFLTVPRAVFGGVRSANDKLFGMLGGIGK